MDQSDRLEYSHNGFTYVCRYAPARLSARMGFRMAAVIAPVLQGLAKLTKAEGAFSAAMIYLFTNPALEDTVLALVDAFAPFTEVIVEGSSPPVSFTLSSKIDAHFAGHQDDLQDWLVRVGEQNCGSFLGGLLRKSQEAEKRLTAFREAAAAAEKSSTSPSAAVKSG